MTDARERIVEKFLRTAKVEIGRTIETGTVRIHRYRDHLVVWDLTNAGKRGKKVERVSFTPSYSSQKTESDPQVPLDRLSTMLEDYDSLAEIVGTVKDLLLDYPGSIVMNSSFERGVDVTPGGFKELTIRTPHLSVEVGFKEFRVKDLDDENNEPTCIPAIKGGLKSIPVFYRWVSDNADSIKQMKYRDVLNQMRQLGIQYHDYCAMD